MSNRIYRSIIYYHDRTKREVNDIQWFNDVNTALRYTNIQINNLSPVIDAYIEEYINGVLINTIRPLQNR